jgi:peroxin-16
MALRKYGLGAWRPWLISLSVELTAYMASIQNQAKSGPASTLDKAELSRRRRLLLLYLLRSPLYYTFTKSRLDGVRHWLSSKPLLSLLGNILGNYQPLWETIYFYSKLLIIHSIHYD